MDRIDITRGQLLTLAWDLPVSHELAEEVNLGIEGEALVFERDGQVLKFMTTNTEEKLNFIGIDENTWKIQFQSLDYEWLPYGENTFMFTIYDQEGNLLVDDEGIVCVHHG